jgi:hypothetical protein
VYVDRVQSADGRLSAAELDRLRLSASLLVFSPCSALILVDGCDATALPTFDESLARVSVAAS